MNFASEPGRDDGSLPPLNIVIPDDARELDRDVIAYRRELRAKRRRQRLLRLLRPFNKAGLGGQVTIVPLIAACLAMTLVGGALLSVVTMSPAAAPTLGGQPTLTTLPAGSVQLDGHSVPARSLTSSAIALLPASCQCGPALERLADQAAAAHVKVYFAGSGTAIPQLPLYTTRFGDGRAESVADTDGVLTTASHPAGFTVLLVFRDATAEVLRNLSANFQLGSTLSELTLAGRTALARAA